ncbi:hypothetical protein, partial [Burkholderia territorii]|uniref:hypothetical protein n=1 Tax=Burkholderia territorii TaxID=1503055 RepID=UPI001E2DDB7C
RFFIAVPLWNGLYTVTVLNAGSRSNRLELLSLAGEGHPELLQCTIDGYNFSCASAWGSHN